MPHRRSSTVHRFALASLTLALVALVASCASPAVPTVEITSHADGQRIFGSRTITLAGTATNTAQVQVLVDGSVIATVDVVAGAFQANVTLGDNLNEIRVQTPSALVGDDIELVYPWVDATTFRPMDVAIGQADKTSNTSGASATQIASSTYGTPLYVDGILYVPDASNNRVLGFIGLPTTDGAAADFVLGQASFTANTSNDDDQNGVSDATPTARTMSCPSAVASDGTRLLVADACNLRILIYNALPTTSFAPADVVVGQATMTAVEYTPCSLDEPFAYVERLAVGGGKLVVPEYDGHRVLIWNTIPTANGTEPDLVLGQPGSGATCVNNDDNQDGFTGDPSARTFFLPWDAWTDGDRLLISDTANYRVLLWEAFPTTDFAPADVVIGQASMTTRVEGSGATGFGNAWTLASNGNQILVPDYDNSRVLVYNTFPSANGATADAVLGQASFANTVRNDDNQDGVEDANPSARTMGRSFGAWLGEGVMLVNDLYNNRYALFVD
ncbi:MAG: hypothetical protein EA416_13100 [Trueperaceae bacterium]|nr:MAG: hypothetical protein EA416_13100 [Trueperaceae bacterium]